MSSHMYFLVILLTLSLVLWGIFMLCFIITFYWLSYALCLSSLASNADLRFIPPPPPCPSYIWYPAFPVSCTVRNLCPVQWITGPCYVCTRYALSLSVYSIDKSSMAGMSFVTACSMADLSLPAHAHWMTCPFQLPALWPTCPFLYQALRPNCPWQLHAL